MAALQLLQISGKLVGQLREEKAERLPPLNANTPLKLGAAFYSLKLNGFLCLCCERCVFNLGTKVSATEKWKLQQLMKMVWSSDVRLCGLSNWVDCLIPLPLRFSLWRPVKLTIAENNMHRRIGGARGKRVEMEKRRLGRKGASLRPPPKEMRRQAEEGRVCGGSSVRVPELISLSNIRYRPQTHTAIALPRSITYQVQFLRAHFLICSDTVYTSV